MIGASVVLGCFTIATALLAFVSAGLCREKSWLIIGIVTMLVGVALFWLPAQTPGSLMATAEQAIPLIVVGILAVILFRLFQWAAARWGAKR